MYINKVSCRQVINFGGSIFFFIFLVVETVHERNYSETDLFCAFHATHTVISREFQDPVHVSMSLIERVADHVETIPSFVRVSRV